MSRPGELRKMVAESCADSKEVKTIFSKLPISQRTKKGLKGKFIEMTPIQREAIPTALSGKDVLGIAKTGSGKTLSFLVPLLESLYRSEWTHLDGLGALVVAPTRELAVQIFDVLRSVGAFHSYSAGLVIGGKDFETEAACISQMNILVATPGRLLHHLENTPGFGLENLKVFVLDEADRCLDKSFSKTVSAIVGELPKKVQRLLFSATHTPGVTSWCSSTVAVVGVHKDAISATPVRLKQMSVITEEINKLDCLYWFVKSHSKEKMLVFLSSCKEVRYIWEAFTHVGCGVRRVLCMHGRMGQDRRMTVLQNFNNSNDSCILFCTDVAARGLDFQGVDWVVQADVPEDTDTYVHRVGRTARFKSGGKALMIVLPGEEYFLDELASKKVFVERVNANTESFKYSVSESLKSMIAENVEMGYLSKKAFITYVKSMYLRMGKRLAESVNMENLAKSFGLPGVPTMRFVRTKAAAKNMNADFRNSLRMDTPLKPAKDDKVSKLMRRQNTTVFAKSRESLRDLSNDSDPELDEEELLVPKRELVSDRKRKLAWGDGLAPEKDLSKIKSSTYGDGLREEVLQADIVDKQVDRERVRTMHKKQKHALREAAMSYSDSNESCQSIDSVHDETYNRENISY